MESVLCCLNRNSEQPNPFQLYVFIVCIMTIWIMNINVAVDNLGLQHSLCVLLVFQQSISSYVKMELSSSLFL